MLQKNRIKLSYVRLENVEKDSLDLVFPFYAYVFNDSLLVKNRFNLFQIYLRSFEIFSCVIWMI